MIGVYLFSSCKTLSPHSKRVMIEISDLRVYKDYQQQGFTTAGAFSHYDDMKRQEIALVLIDKESKEMIEIILNRAKEEKHHQSKYGTRIIFSEMNLSGDAASHKVIFTSVGPVYNLFGKFKEDSAFIIDLTKMISYKVTNLDDLKWLSEFADLMKSN